MVIQMRGSPGSKITELDILCSLIHCNQLGSAAVFHICVVYFTLPLPLNDVHLEDRAHS